jgi:hypothetical protein
MGDLEKVRDRIREIAGRRKNVTADEIEWVVNQLGALGYSVRCRVTGRGGHAILFGVENQRFSVVTHHSGSKQLKPVYVDHFLDAMTELGLYED